MNVLPHIPAEGALCNWAKFVLSKWRSARGTSRNFFGRRSRHDELGCSPSDRGTALGGGLWNILFEFLKSTFLFQSFSRAVISRVFLNSQNTINWNLFKPTFFRPSRLAASSRSVWCSERSAACTSSATRPSRWPDSENFFKFKLFRAYFLNLNYPDFCWESGRPLGAASVDLIREQRTDEGAESLNLKKKKNSFNFPTWCFAASAEWGPGRERLGSYRRSLRCGRSPGILLLLLFFFSFKKKFNSLL